MRFASLKHPRWLGQPSIIHKFVCRLLLNTTSDSVPIIVCSFTKQMSSKNRSSLIAFVLCSRKRVSPSICVLTLLINYALTFASPSSPSGEGCLLFQTSLSQNETKWKRRHFPSTFAPNWHWWMRWKQVSLLYPDNRSKVNSRCLEINFTLFK